jgi:predicted transcriptional regulator
METFYNVLFEISNEDRHRILLQLDKKSMNLTQLSKKLDLTLTETSRHLSRIVRVGVASKEADGHYRIKPFGRLFLSLLQGEEFISKHREYFNSHSLARLPQEFIGRLGELADSTYTKDVMKGVSIIETMIMEAEEYIWMIHDQYLMSAYHLVGEAVKRGVQVKTIDPKIYPSSHKPRGEVSDEDKESLSLALTTGLLQMGILDQLDLFLWMSEKEVAIVAFPTLYGKFDYIGFTSTNKRVHKWCSDLFSLYWERIEPKHHFTLF